MQFSIWVNGHGYRRTPVVDRTALLTARKKCTTSTALRFHDLTNKHCELSGVSLVFVCKYCPCSTMKIAMELGTSLLFTRGYMSLNRSHYLWNLWHVLSIVFISICSMIFFLHRWTGPQNCCVTSNVTLVCLLCNSFPNILVTISRYIRHRPSAWRWVVSITIICRTWSGFTSAVLEWSSP